MRSVVLLAAVLTTACATYDQRLEDVHRAYYDGRPGDAVGLVESELEGGLFDSENDHDLLRLEMASALMAAERYAEAADVLTQVDDALEVLDYTSDTIEEVGAFIASGEAQTYRCSPPEKLLINTQGMITRLAAGDLSGAQVEAGRAGVLLAQSDVPEEDRYGNRLVHALGGFCYEMGGRQQEADDFQREVDDNPLLRSDDAPPAGEGGTILVLVQLGKAPIRRELTAGVMVDGVLHQLRVPVLADRDGAFNSASVVLDGAAQGRMPVLLDLGAQLDRRYEDELPVMLAAAATQAVARGLVSEAVNDSLQSDDDEVADDIFAFLASAAAEFALAEIQQADTRCWNLLPDSFAVMRLDVLPGRHQLSVELTGTRTLSLPFEVDVPVGGYDMVHVVSDTHGSYTPPRPLGEEDLSTSPAAIQAIGIISEASVIVDVLD
jgi:hypothetical protein